MYNKMDERASKKARNSYKNKQPSADWKKNPEDVLKLKELWNQGLRDAQAVKAASYFQNTPFTVQQISAKIRSLKQRGDLKGAAPLLCSQRQKGMCIYDINQNLFSA
jgi:hypothetical protein